MDNESNSDNIREGARTECGGCARVFPLEFWRVNDGPCQNDKFYCVTCLADAKCGCITTDDEGEDQGEHWPVRAKVRTEGEQEE